MPRTQSSQPTIREALSPLDRLTPAVSAQQIYTYMQARPGYVERDRTAGSDLVRLAAALDAFGGSFQKAATRYMDKRIAEDVAEAEQLSREHPELTRNMEAWREAAEANPAVLNKSPWVKRYVEHAILRNEAQTIDAELRNFYVTSGLVNERDTKKVAEAVNAKMGELVKNSSASKYEDPLALGPNFHRPLRNATGNILAMHTASVEAQNAKLVMQQAHQNIDNMLRGLTDIRLPGGLNPHIPADAASLADRHAAALQTEMDNMMRLGFRQADLVAFARDSVLRTGGPVSRMEAVLQKVTVPGLDGKRISLLSQPGVREELDRQKDIATDRAWKAEERAWTRRKRALQLAAEEARKMGFADGDAQTPKTREQFLAAGGTELAYDDYVTALRFASTAQSDPLPANRLGMKEVADLESGLSTGSLGLGDLHDVRDRLTGEEYSRLRKVAENSRTEEGKTQAAYMQNFISVGLKTLYGLDKGTSQQLIDDPASRIGELGAIWDEVNAMALSALEERENLKRKLGVDTLSAEQNMIALNSAISNAYGKMGERRRKEESLDAAAKAWLKTQPSEGGLPRNAGPWELAAPLKNTWHGLKGLFGSYDAGLASLKALNSVMPPVRADTPVVDYTAFKNLTWENGQPVLTTQEDMLNLYRAYMGTPDWRTTFFITTGRQAEDLGLTDMQQAARWLREQAALKGYAPRWK